MQRILQGIQIIQRYREYRYTENTKTRRYREYRDAGNTEIQGIQEYREYGTHKQ